MFGKSPFLGGWVVNRNNGKVVHYGEGFRLFTTRKLFDGFLERTNTALSSMQSSVTNHFLKSKDKQG